MSILVNCPTRWVTPERKVALTKGITGTKFLSTWHNIFSQPIKYELCLHGICYYLSNKLKLEWDSQARNLYIQYPFMGICYHAAFSKPLPRNPIYSNLSSRSRQDYLIVERFHNTSPSRIIVIVLIMRQQWLGRTSTGNAGRLINAGWVKMVTTLQLRSDEDRKKVPKILIAGQFKLI